MTAQIQASPPARPTASVGISAFFAICMIAIGTVAGLGAAWLVGQAFVTYRSAYIADISRGLAGAILGMEEKLLAERVPVTDALSAEAPAAPALRGAIQDGAAAVERTGGEILERLDANGYTDDTKLREKVTAMLARNRTLQTDAAADAALPKTQRNPQVLASDIKGVGEMVSSLEPELDHVAALLLHHDGALMSLLDVSRAAWRIRLDGGLRTQAMIASMVARVKLPIEALERVAGRDAALLDDWREIDNGLARLPEDAQLREAAVSARQKFDTGSVLLHSMVEAGRSSGDYPLTFAQFGPQTLPPLLAALTVRDAALAASGRKVDLLYHDARLGLGLSVALMLLTGMIAFAVTRMLRSRIVTPLSDMTSVIDRLAGGDLASEVPARHRTREITRMSAALETLRRGALTARQAEQTQLAENAAKNRRQKAMDLHIHEFSNSVAGVMDRFTTAAAAMRQTAADVSASARQTGQTTTSTVHGAEATAHDLSAVAAAAEEMACSITEISRQISHVTRSVRLAVRRASETDAKVASLSQAADRIGDVVRVINSIASQTNLLALNATIEAARAGEAGRGFAVVAGEVKALAAQTARATEQIGAQILDIRGATEEAVRAVGEVVSAISEVDSTATSIAAAVEEQSAATREITSSVQTVSITTAAALQAMRGVLDIAESTSASSLTAISAAEEVGQSAATLRTEVTDFLSVIADGEERERRNYERMSPPPGTKAILHFAGRSAISVAIRDVSRGGVSVDHRCDDQPGVACTVDLADCTGIAARVARNAGDFLAVSFSQNKEGLARLDRALQAIMPRAAA